MWYVIGLNNLLFCDSNYFNFMFFPSVEPKFVGSYMIADNEDRDDNKVYFFFTEKALEAENKAHAIHSRVGRLCLVRNVFLPHSASLSPDLWSGLC